MAQALIFFPQPWVLGFALALDFFFGDPVYSWHPIRLMGNWLLWVETILFRIKWNGIVGGIWLYFLVVAPFFLIWFLPAVFLKSIFHQTGMGSIIPALWDGLWIYALMAFGDLKKHVSQISRACDVGEITKAREACAQLVGRDVHHLDASGCIRAGLESLSENFVDGVISPLFWLTFFGIPGLIFFKAASNLDSMVGYRNARYLYFGRFGARLDDVLNWLPARLTWLAIAGLAALSPRLSGKGALIWGWRHHSLFPSPNSGWPEAALAGALKIRLVGPIEKNGVQVANTWIGDPACTPNAESKHVRDAFLLMNGIFFLASVAAILWMVFLKNSLN